MLSLPASAAEIADMLTNKTKNNENNNILFEFFIAFHHLIVIYTIFNDNII